MQLLEIIDVTEFTSMESLEAIFKSLGKLQQEALVEKFLLAFRARGTFMNWNFHVDF